MFCIIEKVKELLRSKAEKKTECELQQEKKPEDNTQEQITCSEEDGSN
jgi:hypothetical protein